MKNDRTRADGATADGARTDRQQIKNNTVKSSRKSDSKTKYLTLTAVYAAIIFVFTAYLHIPNWTGYVHVGDGVLFLAASMLPPGYAAVAGAVGAGLADVLSGYAVWAPGTVVIKSLTALFYTSKSAGFLCRRNYIALLPSLLLCAGGYYLYESLITGNWAAPLAGIPGYLTQTALSALLYIIVGKSFDRMHLKGRILGGTRR